MAGGCRNAFILVLGLVACEVRHTGAGNETDEPGSGPTSAGGTSSASGTMHTGLSDTTGVASGSGGGTSTSETTTAGPSTTESSTGGGGADNPQLVATGADHAREPRLAVDPAGNATVVWWQQSESEDTLWARRFDAASESWEAPERIDDGAFDSLHVVACDGAGNVHVLWNAGDVRGRLYEIGAGTWGPTEIVGAPAFAGPEIEVADGGGALAVWQVGEPGPDETRYARFSEAQKTWTAPAQVEGVRNIWQHSGNRDGVVDMAWAGSGQPDLSWIRFDPAVGAWGTPMELATPSGGPLRIVVDQSGNSTVLYVLLEDMYHEALWTRRYDAGTSTWGSPQRLVVMAMDAIPQQITLTADDDGNVMALWNEVAIPQETIRAARYVAASDLWEPATTVAAPEEQWGMEPQASGDRQGAVFMAGVVPTCDIGIHTATYSPASGWSPLEALDGVSGLTEIGDIETGSEGHSFLAWAEGESDCIVDTDVWVYRFP